jgi:AraC family transcriptional regulator
MNNATSTIQLTGVVPSICDAEAGRGRFEDGALPVVSLSTDIESGDRASQPAHGSDGRTDTAEHGFSMGKLRSVMTELCAALRSALDDERGTAEERLRRASELLTGIGDSADVTRREDARGGLSPWQIRKVTNHVEANLDRSIRNEELASLARLNPSYFGRAFRISFGEPPHEYVIRRRVERAQGLMLSSNASLSDIALDCGLADQSHLTRLFRRIVGESPRAWRRARLSIELNQGGT